MTRLVLAVPALALLVAGSVACSSSADSNGTLSDDPTTVVQEPAQVDDGYLDTPEPTATGTAVNGDDYVGTWTLTAAGNGTVILHDK